MKRERFLILLGGVAGLLCVAGWGCSSEETADRGEPAASTQAALSGNVNYWITAADPSSSTGLAITGLSLTIAATQDLVLPHGMSIQLNGWSSPDANVTWQQYGFSVAPPSLSPGIENWPTDALRSQLGLPPGGSFVFAGESDASLPTVPYGAGILPAGYALTITLQNDSSGNVSGASFSVTDICGNTTTVGPIEIVGTSLAASHAQDAQATIPESALAPIYALQTDLVNIPGRAFIFSSGQGTITYTANEPLYASTSQPSWTAAQGVVTAENSDVAYSVLSPTPSNKIVQYFGLATCECSGSSCVMPTGSYQSSCTGCAVAPSDAGACILTCTSCKNREGNPVANPSLQLPCAGSVSNGAVGNNSGTLQLSCTFIPNDAGVVTAIDAGCTAPSGADDGGSTREQDGSVDEEDAGGSSKGAGTSADSGKGDTSSEGGSPGGDNTVPPVGVSSSGCGCSLPGLHAESPAQSFGLLAVPAIIWLRGRRKRKV